VTGGGARPVDHQRDDEHPEQVEEPDVHGRPTRGSLARVVWVCAGEALRRRRREGRISPIRIAAPAAVNVMDTISHVSLRTPRLAAVAIPETGTMIPMTQGR